MSSEDMFEVVGDRTDRDWRSLHKEYKGFVIKTLSDVESCIGDDQKVNDYLFDLKAHLEEFMFNLDAGLEHLGSLVDEQGADSDAKALLSTLNDYRKNALLEFAGSTARVSQLQREAADKIATDLSQMNSLATGNSPYKPPGSVDFSETDFTGGVSPKIPVSDSAVDAPVISANVDEFGLPYPPQFDLNESAVDLTNDRGGVEAPELEGNAVQLIMQALTAGLAQSRKEGNANLALSRQEASDSLALARKESNDNFRTLNDNNAHNLSLIKDNVNQKADSLSLQIVDVSKKTDDLSVRLDGMNDQQETFCKDIKLLDSAFEVLTRTFESNKVETIDKLDQLSANVDAVSNDVCGLRSETRNTVAGIDERLDNLEAVEEAQILKKVDDILQSNAGALRTNVNNDVVNNLLQNQCDLSAALQMSSTPSVYFSGEKTQFIQFLQAFEFSYLKSIGDSNKRFVILQKHLKGEALHTVSPCALAPAGTDRYDMAVSLLKEAYGNRYAVLQAYKDLLFNGPCVAESSASYRNLSINLKNFQAVSVYYRDVQNCNYEDVVKGVVKRRLSKPMVANFTERLLVAGRVPPQSCWNFL